MKYDDIKVGEYYEFTDSGGDPEILLLFIIGRDPFSGKFVASCDEWLNKVDLLEFEDANLMEKI